MSGLTFYGLSAFIGRTVAAFVCGLDCGNYVVAVDGSIAVPYQSDPDGLFTAAYAINIAANPPTTPSTAILTTTLGWGAMATTVTISSVNYTIPVALGCVYTSRGQVVRPDIQHQGQNGPGLGKTRRVHMLAANLATTVNNTLSFGTDFGGTLVPALLPGNGLTQSNQTVLFNGVYWYMLNHEYDFDGMLAWQVSRPVPCIVTAVSSFIHAEDR